MLLSLSTSQCRCWLLSSNTFLSTNSLSLASLSESESCGSVTLVSNTAFLRVLVPSFTVSNDGSFLAFLNRQLDLLNIHKISSSAMSWTILFPERISLVAHIPVTIEFLKLPHQDMLLLKHRTLSHNNPSMSTNTVYPSLDL